MGCMHLWVLSVSLFRANEKKSLTEYALIYEIHFTSCSSMNSFCICTPLPIHERGRRKISQCLIMLLFFRVLLPYLSLSSSQHGYEEGKEGDEEQYLLFPCTTSISLGLNTWFP